MSDLGMKVKDLKAKGEAELQRGRARADTDKDGHVSRDEARGFITDQVKRHPFRAAGVVALAVFAAWVLWKFVA